MIKMSIIIVSNLDRTNISRMYTFSTIAVTGRLRRLP